jgi:hypothetical protein
LTRGKPKRRLGGDRELFKDDLGRFRPGYLTTSELIAELGSEPADTARYASLAAEAARRAARRAFPARRVPTLIPADESLDPGIRTPSAGANQLSVQRDRA